MLSNYRACSYYGSIRYMYSIEYRNIGANPYIITDYILSICLVGRLVDEMR